PRPCTCYRVRPVSLPYDSSFMSLPQRAGYAPPGSLLSSCPRTCVGSLHIGDVGESTVPHEPSLPRTATECIDGMPTSRPIRGGSRTPSGKKEHGEYDEGNEHHDPDDPT